MADESLETRVALAERELAEMRSLVRKIESHTAETAKAVTKLAVLEDRHAETRSALSRAFRELEGQEKRLHAVELELPVLKLVRRWVIGGVSAGVFLIAAAVVRVYLG